MSVLVGNEKGSVRAGSRNTVFAPLRSSIREDDAPGRGEATLEPGDATDAAEVFGEPVASDTEGV
jgi:hypothetical protein